MSILFKSFLMAGAASLVATNGAVANQTFVTDDSDPFLNDTPLSSEELGDARGGFSIGGFKFNFGVNIQPVVVAPIAPVVVAPVAPVVVAPVAPVQVAQVAPVVVAPVAPVVVAPVAPVEIAPVVIASVNSTPTPATPDLAALQASAAAAAAEAQTVAAAAVETQTVAAAPSAPAPSIDAAPLPTVAEAVTQPTQIEIPTFVIPSAPATPTPEAAAVVNAIAPVVTQVTPVIVEAVNNVPVEVTAPIGEAVQPTPPAVVTPVELTTVLVPDVETPVDTSVVSTPVMTADVGSPAAPSEQPTMYTATTGTGEVQTIWSPDRTTVVFNNTMDNVTLTHTIDITARVLNFQDAVTAVASVTTIARATDGNFILGGLY